MLLLALAASPALASFNEKPQTPPSTSSSSGSAPQSSEGKPAREQAELWYHDAYEDVTKAKEILASEKPDAKKAKKLWERSIERAGRALEFDPKYHEALNLQGFAWRNLKNYEKSLAAYSACLALSPDYAPAREYYGQALLESGDRKGAEAQLAHLKKLNSEEHVKLLEAALAATPEKKAETAPASGGH
jgi:tetratricopeptide (TPR) repeat protein